MSEKTTAMPNKKRSGIGKDYIHYIIALAIGLIINFALQPTNGLTPDGVHVIAVIVPTLYLWLTTNTHWTSLLFLGLLVMTRVMTPNEVWAGSFGHFSVVTIIIYMVMNHALRETGVIDKVATWFITRKIVKNRPYVFMAMFFASNVILGMVMENLSLAVIFVGLTVDICEKMGIKKGESFYTCLFMGTLWANCILSIASPIAHALPNIMMGALEAQLGITISYAQWLFVGVPFAIIMFVVLMFVVAIWRPDTSKFKNYDVDEARRADPPLDTRGKITAVVFILVILSIIIPEIFKNVFPGVMGYITSIGVVVPGLLAMSALCIIRTKGQPIFDMVAGLRSVPLHVVIFTGTVCVMSVPISSEVTGISVWLSNLLQPLIENIPDFAIFAILTLAALIMTNFMSNTVTQILFFNLGVALLAGGTFNMGAFAIVIALASCMACFTPSAAVTSPLFFGPGHITMKNSFKHNLIFLGISYLVAVFIIMPLASAFIPM